MVRQMRLLLVPAAVCFAALLVVGSEALCQGDDCANIYGSFTLSRELLAATDSGDVSTNKAHWPGNGWPRPHPWPKPWPRPDPKPQPGPIDKIPAPIDRPGIPIYPKPQPQPIDGPVTNAPGGATPLRKLMAVDTGDVSTNKAHWPGGGWPKPRPWPKPDPKPQPGPEPRPIPLPHPIPGKPIPIDPRPIPIDRPITQEAAGSGATPLRKLWGTASGAKDSWGGGDNWGNGWGEPKDPPPHHIPVDPIPIHPAPPPVHVPVDPPIRHFPPIWHPVPIHGPIKEGGPKRKLMGTASGSKESWGGGPEDPPTHIPVDPIPIRPKPQPGPIPVDPPIHWHPPVWHPGPIHGGPIREGPK